MGAKTWMLVYSDGEARARLASKPTLDRSGSDREATLLFPKEKLEHLGDGSLSWTAPPDDELLIGCFAGVTVVAAKEFGGDYPSKLDQRFLHHANGRNVYLHAMHSVVDWFAFAMWRNGALVRSLSVSPDSGVLEDNGEKLRFEVSYWNGQHPAVDPEDQEDAYPLPFHPLELGEAALRELFGYQLEGLVDPTLLSTDAIVLVRYKRKKGLFNFFKK